MIDRVQFYPYILDMKVSRNRQRLVGLRAVANHLGVSIKTLSRLMKRDRLRPPVTRGLGRRYSATKPALDRWKAAEIRRRNKKG